MHSYNLLRAFAALASIGAVAAQTSTTQSLPDLSQVTAVQSTTSTAATTSAAVSTSATTITSGGKTSISLVVVSLSSIANTASSTSTNSFAVVSLSGLPTVYGAGIPTMIVPYTANAPFMRQSSLPEGTVFIAVGAVLAFLFLCVLLWRGLVAWSINRSVKRAAMASMRSGNEKPMNWGTSTGYNPAKGSLYKDVGESVSMEALTSSGKPVRHFRDNDAARGTPPPANLFFSPTAQARTDAPRPLSEAHGSRNSSYLPAGYYAAPNSHIAGGARNTMVGGPNAPYARNSAYDSASSSPALRPADRAASREESRVSSVLHTQPSNSSLAVGLNGRPSRDQLPGSRAPSAYLDGLFENHTAMGSHDHL